MLQLVQKGEGEATDLLVFSMGDIQATLRRGAPKDTIVYFFNGAGSSNYMTPPLVRDIAKQYPGSYKTITISGFSAGGRAVQRQLDDWWHGDGDSPDAVMIADGLHTAYADPKKKTLVTKPLESIVQYAYYASLEPNDDQTVRRCILWHSSIVPPGYASTTECYNYVKERVEEMYGAKMKPFDFKGDGRPYLSALKLGQFYLITYKGRDAKEHVAEAQMIDEVMQELLPWFSDENKSVPGDFVYFPEVVLRPAAAIQSSFAEQVVWEAHADLLDGIGEDPGKNNEGSALKPYFAEFGINQPNNWCAVSLGTWVRRAARLFKQEPPIEGSPGAKATMAQFQKAGKWIPISEFRAGRAFVKRGMVPIWDRGTPGKPETYWRGHIGIVFEPKNGGGFQTIEGNAGPKVMHLDHTIHEPKLLGFGVL